MTFQQLWKSIKTTWQSRPFAIILPIVALGWYWFKHGHIVALATVGNGGSLPTWPDLVTFAALLATKFERLTALFVGEHDPETLPSPVVAPILVKPPGSPPVVLVLLLGLSLLGLGSVSGCAHINPVLTDVEACAGPACADAATKLVPAVEVVLECDAAAGFSHAALPACAENGLSALAAALGPDGWRVVGCITNALERDLARPENVRVRASAARKAFGR